LFLGAGVFECRLGRYGSLGLALRLDSLSILAAEVLGHHGIRSTFGREG
jgi:hypothetical protein